MKLPRDILIGPHLYKVRSGKKAAAKMDDGQLGESCSRSLTIWVHPNQHDSSVADTLLHEVLHACWDQTSLRCLDSAQEEAAVSSLAPLLLAVLRANPDLVDALVGR